MRGLGYDLAGQLTSTVVSAGVFAGDATWTYDAAGNRTTQTQPGSVTGYLSNALNQLTQTQPSPLVVKGLVSQAAAVQVNGVSATVAVDNSFVAQVPAIPGNQVLTVTAQAGAAHSIQRFQVQDGQTLVYDPFGSVIGGTKDSNGLRYVGAAGVFSDDDLGLQYMWNRWYDPQLGRFISRDPLGFGGGDLNLYSYVGNNPLNGIDPMGLTNWSMVGGGVLKAGGGALGFAGLGSASTLTFGLAAPLVIVGAPASGWALLSGLGDIKNGFADKSESIPTIGEVVGPQAGPVAGPLVSWGIDTALMVPDVITFNMHDPKTYIPIALDVAVPQVDAKAKAFSPQGTGNSSGCKK